MLSRLYAILLFYVTELYAFILIFSCPVLLDFIENGQSFLFRLFFKIINYYWIFILEIKNNDNALIIVLNYIFHKVYH